MRNESQRNRNITFRAIHFPANVINIEPFSDSSNVRSMFFSFFFPSDFQDPCSFLSSTFFEKILLVLPGKFMFLNYQLTNMLKKFDWKNSVNFCIELHTTFQRTKFRLNFIAIGSIKFNEIFRAANVSSLSSSTEQVMWDRRHTQSLTLPKSKSPTLPDL